MALRPVSGVPQYKIVTRMPLATIALLCKQTTDNFRTRPPPDRVTGYYLLLITSISRLLKMLSMCYCDDDDTHY